MIILLIKDREVLIDFEDLHRVLDFSQKWKIDNKGYVYCDVLYKRIFLHKFILKLHYKKIKVDHKDRDTLNNRRENLRVITHGNNRVNSCVNYNSKTGIKSVLLRKDGKFRVNIKKDGKLIHGGIFETKEEAAIKAKELRKQLFGEFEPN